jgi:hypothetical protein
VFCGLGDEQDEAMVNAAKRKKRMNFFIWLPPRNFTCVLGLYRWGLVYQKSTNARASNAGIF